MSGPEEAPLYPSDAGRTVAGSPEEVIAEALAGTLQAELALSALKAAGYLVIGPDAETRHVVDFKDDGWTLKHPLACRPNLFACPFNDALKSLDGPPPDGPGQYHVDLEDDYLVIGERPFAASLEEQ